MLGRGSVAVPKSMLFSLAKVSAERAASSRTSLSSSNRRSLPASPRSANTACTVRRHIEAKALKAPLEKQVSASLNSSSTSSGR